MRLAGLGRFVLPRVVGVALVIAAATLNVWTLAPLLQLEGLGDPRRPLWIRTGISLFEALALAGGLLFLLHRPTDRIVGAARQVLAAGVGLVLTFVVLESVFPLVLVHLSLSLQRHVARPFHLLAQSSKRASLPRNYIAIVGDSYGAGAGDWHLGLDARTNAPFHSAHVIHRRLGVDVLSFAQPGAGSAAGLVRIPIVALRTLRHRLAVEDPRRILVYFYEGNDLEDNLRELRALGPVEGLAGPQPHVVARLAEQLPSLAAPSPDERLAGRLLASKFLLSLTGQVKRRLFGQVVRPAVAERVPSESFNAADVGGRTVRLPDGLQGPGLELTPDEARLALALFEASLRVLGDRFAGADLAVVYLPSVLSTYALRGPVAAQPLLGRRAVYRAEDVVVRSETLAAEVAEIARRTDARFIDTRPALRAAARRAPIHGPKDWDHLNREGYEALGHAIADAVRTWSGPSTGSTGGGQAPPSR